MAKKDVFAEQLKVILCENKELKDKNFKLKLQLELIEGITKGILFNIPFKHLFGDKERGGRQLIW